MLPRTLRELQSSSFGQESYRKRTIKDEMRINLIRKLEAKASIFPGIVGYEETVVPQVVNAILSRHNMILLGLRGQAKSRILRGLIEFLDDVVPVIEGCEINDNPFCPICRRCRDLMEEMGDNTRVDYRTKEDRYVEKLATPDVTIADIIGDIDPIKAAKGGHAVGSELSVHYGLLPRANRGIFAINELPDLAGKIQVGLFNIMQEGDVQIKGYPVRLPLDVVLVFSANPEDYTARGKIVTPLKDRIGSEIKTHYPGTLEHGLAITEQEAWIRRNSERKILVPHFIKQIVEAIAFKARADQRIDKRSGVSQRLPISCLENVLSNAERRSLITGEDVVVPRVADIYAALPAITGKLELEYEGELKGADSIARDLIRQAVQMVFRQYFPAADFKPVVEWFETGGHLKFSDVDSASIILARLDKVQGLLEKLDGLDAGPGTPPAIRVAAGELILEGLYSIEKISRSEERGYAAVDRKATQELYRDYTMERNRYKKPLN
ncbi:MAG: magnesium chelatase [Acidobacteria bacterium 13_1_40CM_3_56_11]|nr:MAG: magnesium chelatase [Acidobacteria bacterium 13_1_40CM_56_16]OLD21696.1 MAG: magnesium chelatase [Acidobacteria bacterium 13_1_40CM_3_56_11]OLD71887.1 MAG: magnesium chelatase [Acidobacteria bacterium 13_1_40CM_2_56_11]